MSCPPGPPTFRLLDAYVGWDDASVEGLTAPDDLPGLSLAPAVDGGTTTCDLAPYLPPPRLAPGCDPCEWYLLTCAPAARLVHRGRCTDGWQPVAVTTGQPDGLVEPVAVAAAGQRVAVADPGRGVVLVWAGDGRLVASIPFDDAAVVAFAPDGDVVVAAAGSNALHVFDASGLPRRVIDTGLAGAITRIGFGPSPGRPDAGGCAVWLVTAAGDTSALWRAATVDARFEPATLDDLATSIAPSTLRTVTDRGFCLAEPSTSGVDATMCFDWHGRPHAEQDVGGALAAPVVLRGQLLTRALDSGIPRCRWHRVRVDADVPDGASVEVAVAASEEAEPPAQGQLRVDPGWEGFDAGVPHPDDWQVAPDGSLDFLVRQPAGRYVFVRVRLRGDGSASPLVRRIRLDLPRTTSAASLPGVYGQDPTAWDFTERFLSLFDASIEELDRHVERHPALLDAAGVPPAVLPWLADFVGIAFAAEWGADQRRALIAAAPELYRARGTPGGLRRAVELVFGVTPVVEELGRLQAWGAVGHDARLRSVRLFGTTRARMRLGRSALSRTPLNSYGDPGADARAAGAYRIRVLVPRSAGTTPTARSRVRRLIATQAPAHVVAEVRFGADGFLLGGAAAVGVDTALTPPPAPVLGAGATGNVRLGRGSVLWPSRGGRSGGIGLGVGATVGVSTAME